MYILHLALKTETFYSGSSKVTSRTTMAMLLKTIFGYMIAEINEFSIFHEML